MTGLQEALDFLGPITWDDFPQTQEGLREYVSEIAQKARLVAESVPEPPPAEQGDDARHDADDAGHRGKNKVYDVTTSAARYNTTDPDILSYQSNWSKPLKPGNARDNPHGIQLYKLQGHDGKGTWFGRRSVHDGMPFSHWKRKMSSELEETLQWNTARLGKGQAPDRVVRGMGVTKKAVDVEVVDADGTTILGGVRVYDIAAHFPKPTTPRDFVQANFTWNDPVGPDGESSPAARGRGQRCRSWLSISKPCLHPDLPQLDGYIRGQYDSVEFIREVQPTGEDDGQGSSSSLANRKSVTWSDPNLAQHEPTPESPKQDAKKDKKDRKRGKTESSVQEKQNEQQSDSPTVTGSDVPEDETNPYPVEWIMVTRSDPGGSIPRWIIEKGTPKSIWADTVKFLDWASREESPQDGAGDESKRASEDERRDWSSDEGFDTIHPEERRNGLIANFGYLLNAGLERYAPQAVLDYVPYRNKGSSEPVSSEDDDDDTSSTISTIPSSKKKKKEDTASMASQSKVSLSGESTSDTQSQQQHIATIDAMQLDKKEKLTSHEKQLAKLAARKRETQSKLEETRNEIEALRLDAGTTTGNNGNSAADKKDKPDKKDKKDKKDKDKKEKKDKKDKDKDSTRDAASRSSTDVTRTKSRSSSASSLHQAQQNNTSRSSSKSHAPTDHHNLPKAASNLFSTESKLLKKITKIESDQLKTAGKIEAQQKKQHEREEKTRARADMEALRREVDSLKKEVERLRGERGQWVDLVAALQSENVKLSRASENGGNGEGGE